MVAWQVSDIIVHSIYSANISLFNVNNKNTRKRINYKNTRKRYGTFSKLTIKTPENVIDVLLVSLLLTQNTGWPLNFLNKIPRVLQEFSRSEPALAIRDSNKREGRKNRSHNVVHKIHWKSSKFENGNGTKEQKLNNVE